jgi:hypothetical protein
MHIGFVFCLLIGFLIKFILACLAFSWFFSTHFIINLFLLLLVVHGFV